MIVGLVLLLIVTVLVVAAVIADGVARDRATSQVAQEIRTALDLPAGHPVEVEIAGASVLMQLIGGRFSEVVVRTENVEIEPLSGDLELQLSGVPLDPDQAIQGIDARVSVPEAVALAGGAGLTDLPFRGLELDPGVIRVTTAVPLFGTELPVTVSLAPSVDAGFLRLTPTGISLADGVDLPLGDVLGLLGLDAEGEALAPRSFCVDGRLPDGVSLRTVVVTDEAIELALGGENVVLGGTNSPRLGSCG